MFKFCRKFDEDENAFVGGVTVCECLTNLFEAKDKEDHMHTDEIVVKMDELVDEEYQDIEANKHVSQPVDESKLATCCKAFCCCKVRNIVPKEVEMAQIKLASEAIEKVDQMETTQFGVGGDEQQQSLLPLENHKSENMIKSQVQLVAETDAVEDNNQEEEVLDIEETESDDPESEEEFLEPDMTPQH